MAHVPGKQYITTPMSKPGQWLTFSGKMMPNIRTQCRKCRGQVDFNTDELGLEKLVLAILHSDKSWSEDTPIALITCPYCKESMLVNLSDQPLGGM
jgi:hypothetical protein